MRLRHSSNRTEVRPVSRVPAACYCPTSRKCWLAWEWVGNDLVLRDTYLHSDICPRPVALTSGPGVPRAVDRLGLRGRANTNMRSAVRPRRTQASHDHRSSARSSGDLPAVLLGKRKSIVWRTVDHADYPLRSVWRLQRPDIDGIGRAISDPRALDRARHCLQHCGHAVWRLCTVLRDLADPSDRHADRASLLSNIRCCGWTAGSLIPQRTRPRCEIFGRGRRRTNCRLVLTVTSDNSCPLWVKSRHFETSDRCPLYPQKRTSIQGLRQATVRLHRGCLSREFGKLLRRIATYSRCPGIPRGGNRRDILHHRLAIRHFDCDNDIIMARRHVGAEQPPS